MRKLISSFIILFAFAVTLTAQVEKVNYSLKYNSETALFDCYLVVDKGATNKIIDRVQFSAQISLIAPESSNVFITESYMPLINNQNYSGDQPASWSVSNEIEAPLALPNSRIIGITPQTIPTAFYNDLKPGDEIKLFSFQVSPMVNCGRDVRIFDNLSDPTSGKKGMGGADFRNGFTMGNNLQKYKLNTDVLYPNGPIIESIKFEHSNGRKMEIDIATDQLGKGQTGITYEVVSPSGKSAELHQFLNDESDFETGEYKLLAIDNIGCKSEKSFFPLGNFSTTSVEEEPSILTFSSDVYPVPSRGQLNISLKGERGSKVTGHMVNMEGKVVAENVVNQVIVSNEEVIFYDSNLYPGIYNLLLSVDGVQVDSHKILILK